MSQIGGAVSVGRREVGLPPDEMDASTPADRIRALDILRGIALLGMFLVHFNDQAAGSEASGVAGLYRRAVELFFEERFWTMFGILFGVGFAVQLRRAQARGRAFVPIYLRRLLTLAVIGILAHAVFGYHVLFEYAVWGVPLLLVRRWRVRTLLLLLIVSAVSGSLFSIARASYRAAAVGEASARAELAAETAWNQAFRQANVEAQRADSYPLVFRARLQHIVWFYAQPFSFLPVNTFTLFLIGVIGLQLGLFDRPSEHQRLIVAIMSFGIAAWAADTWLLQPLQAGTEPLAGPLVREVAILQLARGFGLIRGTWLAFTYIGVVLLLVARNPAWVARLAPFGWTGRMALTTYVLQIAILDLAFSKYALDFELTTLQALSAGLALFAVNAALSRWWLTRFRFGPLEWLWRSITYGHLQPWRLDAARVC